MIPNCFVSVRLISICQSMASYAVINTHRGYGKIESCINKKIYIYIYIHLHIHTYTHTHMHTYTHTHIHTYIHTYIQTYRHTRSKIAQGWQT